ncbi:MAG TPA: chemotaxis response regulator protein-glutamate methylesterase [Blastocatellia bacterium]|nr:chemotaxis response regulator protein-glutamate methylesterase [Blastocatellia bacterium]
MRQVVTEVLSFEPDIIVTVASDPLIAMEKMKRRRPDVILLDMEMPRMDGLTFLRKVMTENPIPVVVCSGFASEGSDLAFRAFKEGAVDVIAKPQLGLKDFLYDSATMLVDTVRAAACAHLQPRLNASRTPQTTTGSLAGTLLQTPSAAVSNTVIAIGASTGGPEALDRILRRMPRDAPGILIVQHMPAVFTRGFADQLNKVCRMDVREASDGDEVVRGLVLVAPGNRHMKLRKSASHYFVELSSGPAVSRHRPSVDVLFHSVARSAGPNAVGIIMTGMGEDGAEGLQEMKRAGALTIAQSEATSVVFGMPRAAIDRGAADQVVSLDRMAEAILNSGRPITEHPNAVM